MTENITFIEVPLIQGEVEQEQPSCILSYNHEEIFEREPNPPAISKDKNGVEVYNQLGPCLPSCHNKALENIALDASEHIAHISSLTYKYIEVDSVDENDKDVIREQPSYILSCNNEQILYRQPSGLRIDKVDLKGPRLNSPIHCDIYSPPANVMDRNEEVIREQPSFILPCNDEQILYRKPSGLRIDQVDFKSPKLISLMDRGVYNPPTTPMDKNEEVNREQPSYILPYNNEEILDTQTSKLRTDQVDMKSQRLNSAINSDMCNPSTAPMDGNEGIEHEQPSYILLDNSEDVVLLEPNSPAALVEKIKEMEHEQPSCILSHNSGDIFQVEPNPLAIPVEKIKDKLADTVCHAYTSADTV
ncbi:uncharacterized protein LOC136036829 [Artemia franciscana]|uniref:uncharacterized protein LOC136036829 n=1 Tax=Artemia franciscana TaxID=6661 RepID=UPI0032DAD55F